MNLILPSQQIQAYSASALRTLDDFTDIRQSCSLIGGYLYLALITEVETPLLVLYLGRPCEEYLKLAQLARNKCIKQVRTPLEEVSRKTNTGTITMHPGDHRARPMVMGFAGLTEKANEALCLLIAVRSGYMELEVAKAIGEMRNNEYFHILYGVERREFTLVSAGRGTKPLLPQPPAESPLSYMYVNKEEPKGCELAFRYSLSKTPSAIICNKAGDVVFRFRGGHPESWDTLFEPMKELGYPEYAPAE